MDKDGRPSGSVLRVFEARSKTGCAETLAEKFTTTSVEVVQGQPGNQGYFFGRSIQSEDDVFMFVSVWKDLAAIKVLFGEDWESSYLPPGYADLIEDCSLKHIALARDWYSSE